MASPKFFHHFVNVFAAFAFAFASCCTVLFGNGIGKGNGPGRTAVNPRGSVFVTDIPSQPRIVAAVAVVIQF